MSAINQQDRFQQLIIRLVLVVLPTLLIGFVTLRFLNFSYTSLNTGIISQTFYYSLGLLISYSLYYFGARWTVSFLLLWALYWLFEKIINRLPGEFDVFYATARFQLYSTLFLFGWGFGFLLARVRQSYIILFAVLAIVTLVSISNTIDISLTYILIHIFPVVAYGLYMLFLSPIITTRIELDWKKSTRLLGRVGLFALLVLLSFVIAERMLKGNLQGVEKELAARGAKNDNKDKSNDGDYDDRYGLMDKGDDGYRLKDTMRVNTKMSQSDKLMFCSKLDNFFPDGSPIPLYFVYHYLTRYDSVKESFTRDVNVPSFDELEVDPSELPLYYSYTDTSLIRKSKGDKLRKFVQAQVYLSENTWKHSVLGPASVFSLQTIPIEKDFQKTFQSGYKIISYTSELNNAFFVYNVSASPQLEAIQEQRYDELRSVKNYNHVDRQFFDYYTQFPKGAIYDSIARLAHSLVAADLPPVEKVLAVRDYFLQRNEMGARVFRYTLKPGSVSDPNIPSSRMLYNFLFKTHAGYCTYYAGASLFMLRALGIPARFTTGFATINRSDKNKGWYWFYASQAHAWTQVYFPEYGWMDFDMTIGNEDQQDAPKPDGTPPLPPPDPWLVLNAKAAGVKTATKQFDASFSELIFQDTPFRLNKTFTQSIDASICRVLYDEKDTTLAALMEGDSVIIVSYKDEAKHLPQLLRGVPIEQQVQAFPSPIVADEIHIRAREKDKKQNDSKQKKQKLEEKKIPWAQVAWRAAQGLGAMLLLAVFFPLLYLLYRLLRIRLAGNVSTRADQVYRAALYRFHMAGLERNAETPLDFATRQVDPTLGTRFAEFMTVYLRMKYSPAGPQQDDAATINQFANSAGSAVRKKYGLVKSFINYFNLARAYRYFQQPESSDHETPSL